MIAKIVKRQGMRELTALVRYLISPKKESRESAGVEAHRSGRERLLVAECVGELVPPLPGENKLESARRIARELLDANAASRGHRKAPSKDAIHASFSFHPDDNVDAERAIEIAKAAIELGMSGEYPAMYVVHGDRAHLHVHVMVSTVNESGKVFHRHNEYDLFELAMEHCEKEFGLKQVQQRRAVDRKNRREAIAAAQEKTKVDGANEASRLAPEVRYDDSRAVHRRPGSGGATQMALRTGVAPLKEVLQAAILKCAAETDCSRPTLVEFLKRLQASGIQAVPNLPKASGGKRACSGMSYRIGSYIFKASALGKLFSWTKFRDKFLLPMKSVEDEYKLLRSLTGAGTVEQLEMACMITAGQMGGSAESKSIHAKVDDSSKGSLVVIPGGEGTLLRTRLAELVRTAKNEEYMSAIEQAHGTPEADHRALARQRAPSGTRRAVGHGFRRVQSSTTSLVPIGK